MGGSSDKQGHIYCFCCCDVRRAVIIINAINILLTTILLLYIAVGFSFLNLYASVDLTNVTTVDTFVFPTASPSASEIPSRVPSIATGVPSTSLGPTSVAWEDVTEGDELVGRYLQEVTAPVVAVSENSPSMSPSFEPQSEAPIVDDINATEIDFPLGLDASSFVDTTLLRYSLVVVAAVYGGIMLLYIVGIIGAVKYSSIPVGLAMLVYIFQMGLNIYNESYGSAIFTLLYIYPHAVLISEIRKGVMEQETYYERERQSICCV